MLSDRQLVLCELLVLRCRRYDPAAPAELVAIFQKPLLYYLRRLVTSEEDAWDLLQETWMAVFRSLPALRDPRSLPAYVYKTARNKAVAHHRKRRADVRELFADQEPSADSSGEPEEAVISAEDAASVHAALDQLSLAHREVLTLLFLDDLSIDDIAGVLGIPPGTVKSRLHHAKKALRLQLFPHAARES